MAETRARRGRAVSEPATLLGLDDAEAWRDLIRRIQTVRKWWPHANAPAHEAIGLRVWPHGIGGAELAVIPHDEWLPRKQAAPTYFWLGAAAE